MHLGREWAEDKAVVEAGCQSVTCRLVMGMMDLGWDSGGSRVFWRVVYVDSQLGNQACGYWCLCSLGPASESSLGPWGTLGEAQPRATPPR